MSAFGLVANYNSSSESDSEDASELGQIPSSSINNIKEIQYFASVPELKLKKRKSKKEEPELLINPLRSSRTSNHIMDASSSVFYNPFQEELEAKNAILEKHVKLSINPKDINEINGKKICWNYRKGRCKFGHKCKYAHDSDLSGQTVKPTHCNNEALSTFYNEQGMFTNDTQEETQDMRKRKPGLSETIIPNKKSRNIYNQIMLKEKPWIRKD